MGKDDGADVAALHDHSAFGGKLLLQADHPGANGGKDTHTGGRIGDRVIADEAGYVLVVEEDTIFLFAGLGGGGAVDDHPLPHLDGRRPGQSCHGVAVVRRCSQFQGQRGHGAIHGARLEVEQTKMPGQMPGDGALSRTGRAINGDDDLAAGLKSAQRAICKTHARFFVS